MYITRLAEAQIIYRASHMRAIYLLCLEGAKSFHGTLIYALYLLATYLGPVMCHINSVNAFV